MRDEELTERFDTIDQRFAAVDRRFDAMEAFIKEEAAETRRQFDAALKEEGATTRRHFDVVAEGLKDSIQMIANGHKARTDDVGSFKAGLERLETRQDALEIRQAAIEYRQGKLEELE